MARELGRRGFLSRAGASTLAAASVGADPRRRASGDGGTGSPQAPEPQPLDEVTGATVAELLAALGSGALTAVGIARRLLERIDRLDRRGPRLHAVIELNPDALDIAARCDAERRAGRPTGPLHGIPILVKDNIDTGDRMQTSAGSLALTGGPAPRDAFIVARLRASGAVVLGKTNLSEWANLRSTRSTSGWSARGGLTRNPHVLDRNPSGSSSGTAAGVAAGYAPLGIGTETDGSIISPAGVCGIVGIKPTVGLWSRSGIVPISASQDTPGPMARTVGDAALLLAALAGPADPEDVATLAASAACRAALARHDGTRAAGPPEAGLVGARLGVPRDLAGFHPAVDAALERALEAMKDAGAVIVDHLALGPTARLEEAEMEVLLHELKDGLSRYLARRGSSAGGLGSLADVMAFNARERAREMPWFGQELFERAQTKGDLTAGAYRAARARCLALARTRGLDALLASHRLDALICPSNAPAWLTDLENGDHVTGGNTTFAAVAGYPSVTVPMGAAHGLPLGLSFVGAAWTEPRLIALAAGFEAITRARVPPRFLATLVEPAWED